MAMTMEPRMETSPHPRQRMQQDNSMAANLVRLESKVDAVAGEVQEVKVLVASMMPRAEVDGELARRVSLEAYVSDQREITSRLIRLESSPQRLVVWLGVGVGCLSLIITATIGILGMIGGVLMFVLTHYKP